jgi:hypothetical protein
MMFRCTTGSQCADEIPCELDPILLAYMWGMITYMQFMVQHVVPSAQLVLPVESGLFGIIDGLAGDKVLVKDEASHVC